MECNRQIFVSFVLILVTDVVTSSDSGELVKNVSSAAIRFDGIPKNIANNDHWRSLATVDENTTDCAGLQILSDDLQPKYSPEHSFVRKCCPIGENYEKHENGRKCAAETLNFEISVLNATFYESCIEDNESGPRLNYKFGSACATDGNGNNKDPLNKMVLYGKSHGDSIYILQNGSLLSVDQNFTGYEVHNDYCLDMDRDDGELYAIVCYRKLSHHQRVLRAEAYLYSTCLLISVPCLLLTAFFYVKIDELRDFHGKSLACHCICLAISYSFLSIIQLQPNISQLITYVIQYFLLACICWLNVLCFDICFKISYNYLYKSSCSTKTEDKYFKIYAMISFGFPIIPVLWAFSQNTLGIPLYYIKGQHNIDDFTAIHFILPAACLLFFCFCSLLVTLYIFGTTKPNLPNNSQGIQAIYEYEEFFKMKQTAQSIAFLFAVMSICMIIEMFTSHINIEKPPDGVSPFAFFDVLIALQGVFIFIIFVCLPKPLKMIKRWWIAKGTLDIAALNELESLKTTSVTILD
ncbi:probable G-protein coupled receptor Mth-like 14 [Contarinia nasturtii]|uniref:probable G-protein coupled receptor Mth-like 14 n=1 Tax=Contarinia nasturtii TaxID=265458 RepID=UPI0012D4B28E|nr:probable G-protein coupled receptor Mth-like 14 [Contarinia nasturtii]XP_031631587.1 probable G-protein coupled receptor Mth-like 14 [Contarinia nasturtii]XP_031631588.1 probable G-protein coupled receptor Mth-like 14 [Contarinia nasturtii]